MLGATCPKCFPERTPSGAPTRGPKREKREDELTAQSERKRVLAWAQHQREIELRRRWEQERDPIGPQLAVSWRQHYGPGRGPVVCD
jgi:hypothetical protein